MTDSAPPHFRYHPDPVDSGAFEEVTFTCACCSKVRSWRYRLPAYGTSDLRDSLCPWCIADGSAAARFDLVFTDLHDTWDPEVDLGVREEIERRTPGFSGWQQERWLFHCGDAAAYVGSGGWGDVRDLPGAVADLRAQVADWGFDDEEIDAFVESLDVDASPVAHIFGCLACGRHLAYADLD
jgi:uncharacterized protein CbrC (UPF0167 family)